MRKANVALLADNYADPFLTMMHLAVHDRIPRRLRQSLPLCHPLGDHLLESTLLSSAAVR